MICRIDRQTGSLARNGVGFDDEKVTEDIFKLYISYGKKLENESYSYVVVYNDSESVCPTCEGLHKVIEISNTVNIQAIEFDDCTVVVFHENGSSYRGTDGEVLNGVRGQIVVRRKR